MSIDRETKCVSFSKKGPRDSVGFYRGVKDLKIINNLDDWLEKFKIGKDSKGNITFKNVTGGILGLENIETIKPSKEKTGAIGSLYNV